MRVANWEKIEKVLRGYGIDMEKQRWMTVRDAAIFYGVSVNLVHVFVSRFNGTQLVKKEEGRCYINRAIIDDINKKRVYYNNMAAELYYDFCNRFPSLWKFACFLNENNPRYSSPSWRDFLSKVFTPINCSPLSLSVSVRKKDFVETLLMCKKNEKVAS